MNKSVWTCGMIEAWREASSVVVRICSDCCCYLVTLLPCYLVTLLPCYLVTLLPCYLVTLLPCYLVTCCCCCCCCCWMHHPEEALHQQLRRDLQAFRAIQAIAVSQALSAAESGQRARALRATVVEELHVHFKISGSWCILRPFLLKAICRIFGRAEIPPPHAPRLAATVLANNNGSLAHQDFWAGVGRWDSGNEGTAGYDWNQMTRDDWGILRFESMPICLWFKWLSMTFSLNHPLKSSKYIKQTNSPWKKLSKLHIQNKRSLMSLTCFAHKSQVGIWWTWWMPSKQTVISCCCQQGLGFFSHVKVMGETSPWKLKLHLETWKFAEIISGQPDFFSACLIDVFLDFRKMSKIIC